MSKSTRTAFRSAIFAAILLPLACSDAGVTPTGPETPNLVTVAAVLPLAGVGATADVGNTLPDSVAVRVVDAVGNGITGAAVQFTVANGGSASPAATNTGANGVARTMWTLGSAAGVQILEVRAGGPTVSPLMVKATGVAAAPAQVMKTKGDQITAVAGSQVPVAVTVADRFGNPIAGISVAWQLTTGGGSVTPSTSLSDSSGRAIAIWTLGSAADNRIVASVPGSAAAVFSATATPAVVAVASVVVSPAPASIIVGDTLPLLVSTRDASGNVLNGRAVSYQSSSSAVATVSATGLVRAVSPGQAAITATSEGVAGQSMVSVTPPPPAAPSALTATAASTTQINLAWQDNSNTENGFEVEYRVASSPTWMLAATRPSNATTYQQIGLSESTTYAFRVRACLDDVCSSYSVEANATTASLLPPANAPVAPSGLTAVTSAVDSTGEIDLAWQDNSGNETAFEVEKVAGSLGQSWQVIATLPANTTTWRHVGLVPTEGHTYRVRACLVTACSVYTNTAFARTAARPPSPPSAPTGLTPSAPTAFQIDMYWNSSTYDTTDTFEVQYRVGTSATWLPATTQAANTHGYQHVGLTPLTTYTYRVRECRAASLCSAYSVEASATTRSAATPPTAPSTLTALTSAVDSTGEIDLAWQDNSTNETTFEVEKVTGSLGQSWALLATLPANTTTWRHVGLVPTEGHTYRVRACLATACSAYSNEASARTAARPPSPPPAPSGLAASAPTSDEIDVSWRSNGSNVTTTPNTSELQYRIGTSTTWLSAVTQPVGNNSYQHVGLTPLTTYTYRVRECITATLCSAYSAEVAATTRSAATPPTAPSGLTAMAVSTSEIDLAWQDNSTTETTFEIQTIVGLSGQTWALLATVPANTTTWQHTGLQPQSGHYYRVRACLDTACSAYTPMASANVPPLTPSAPTGLSVAVASPTQINLTWQDNSGTENNSKLEYRVGASTTWNVIVLPRDSHSYQHTGLTPSTTYTYRLRACVDTTCSAYTPEASAATMP
jgi:hypothetical protein